MPGQVLELLGSLFPTASSRGVSKQALCSRERILVPEPPMLPCGNGHTQASSDAAQHPQALSPDTNTWASQEDRTKTWVSGPQDPL